jgi:hypothetical protein
MLPQPTMRHQAADESYNINSIHGRFKYDSRSGKARNHLRSVRGEVDQSLTLLTLPGWLFCVETDVVALKGVSSEQKYRNNGLCTYRSGLEVKMASKRIKRSPSAHSLKSKKHKRERKTTR